MVAYYAHSHGNGHFNAAKIFCNKIYDQTIILSALGKEGNNVLQINDEDTNPNEYQSAIKNIPDYAHYLPKSNAKIKQRTKQIIDATIDYDINLACVDVSVETAIIFRMASIPYGYYLLPGNRNDQAHQMAFKAAEFLYVFLPECIFKDTPKEIYNKTFFLGFHSRFEYRENARIVEHNPSIKGKKVLILCGNGGTKLGETVVDIIVDALPHCQFTIVGYIELSNTSKNLNCLGYVHDLEHIISENDVVISSCGVNLTSEILSVKNKFIAIAEDRPYDEQEHILDALVANNLAIAFDLENIKNCVMDYLRLVPPSNLKSLFYDENSVECFKQKIKFYEK